MHIQVKNFLAKVKGLYPQFFNGVKVIEAGSIIINGTPREFFNVADYTGVDLIPGNGVDLIGTFHKIKSIQKGIFDVAISCEMLEHDKYWKASLNALYEFTRPGGLIIVTCAAPGRAEHGTTKHRPSDSPATNDYYRPISIKDFKKTLPEKLFSHYMITTTADNDLQFYGLRI